jgi:hypothetical protein
MEGDDEDCTLMHVEVLSPLGPLTTQSEMAVSTKQRKAMRKAATIK